MGMATHIHMKIYYINAAYSCMNKEVGEHRFSSPGPLFPRVAETRVTHTLDVHHFKVISYLILSCFLHMQYGGARGGYYSSIFSHSPWETDSWRMRTLQTRFTSIPRPASSASGANQAHSQRTPWPQLLVTSVKWNGMLGDGDGLSLHKLGCELQIFHRAQNTGVPEGQW